MRRAVITCFHKYTPFGDEYYEALLDHYLTQMDQYKSEFDKVYLLDSNWGIKDVPYWAKVVKVNPHIRYYDAYKEALPEIQEDLVLFIDNDMVVYREGKIGEAFATFTRDGSYDVVSIIDQIGEYRTQKLRHGNKFCPYWFATRKELLMKYRDIEWGDHMPHSETLGLLTEAMLKDNMKVYEAPDDKFSIHYDGHKDLPKIDLGYYHVRAGSTAPYLLATRKYGDRKTYENYIKNQPKSEYLRHFAWYSLMGGSIFIDEELMKELGVQYQQWTDYVIKFKEYHGLSENL